MRYVLAGLLWLFAVAAHAAVSNPFRADAESIEALINAQYAYLERLPGGRLALTARLRAEAEAVADERSLLTYAERVLLLMADHHAITGRSFSDSWALVPSYADLWIEVQDGIYVIDAVRAGSPAGQAGIRAGDELAAISGIATGKAVETFWADLGATVEGDDRAAFAARVLAAGRRDRPRELTIRDRAGAMRTVQLPSLYGLKSDQPPVTARAEAGALVIRINDALGETGAIGAFDAAMFQARPGQPIVLDLTDTPSGGNTVVARAMMGWFVSRPTGYQVHALPAEERETGIPRQWIEEVLPRPGKHHEGPLTVRVGRWTGSMGEGLAIGFRAIGARVEGHHMAGLRGAVEDHRLANSGLVLKLPTERLYTVDGIPREAFTPGGGIPKAHQIGQAR